MDFSNRSVSAQPPVAAPAHPAPAGHKKAKDDGGGWQRLSGIVLGAAVVILLIALVVFLGVGNSNAESKYVDTNKLQAVFLNTGQVYFGNVKTLNDKFFVLSNIYYLQTSSNGQSSSNSNTSVSLVKLGCELHMPYDQMVINRDQVTFWENLQGDGQVAKAVSTFEKDNPDGQKCADQSSSSDTTTGNSVQNAQTNNGSSNNSTTTP
ncbi:MAG TPA: hypothetical protein VHB51_01120 [Candidatus Saccharimonadales bacterium]|nr:hypothetical protein [Candidatus Saccharimonadales bacterium]